MESNQEQEQDITLIYKREREYEQLLAELVHRQPKCPKHMKVMLAASGLNFIRMASKVEEDSSSLTSWSWRSTLEIGRRGSTAIQPAPSYQAVACALLLGNARKIGQIWPGVSPMSKNNTLQRLFLAAWQLYDWPPSVRKPVVSQNQ